MSAHCSMTTTKSIAAACTYHLGQFTGDAVIDILRTHPMVILGGVPQRNTFFVPAEQFVPSFRERPEERASRGRTAV